MLCLYCCKKVLKKFCIEIWQKWQGKPKIFSWGEKDAVLIGLRVIIFIVYFLHRGWIIQIEEITKTPNTSNLVCRPVTSWASKDDHVGSSGGVFAISKYLPSSPDWPSSSRGSGKFWNIVAMKAKYQDKFLWFFSSLTICLEFTSFVFVFWEQILKEWSVFIIQLRHE